MNRDEIINKIDVLDKSITKENYLDIRLEISKLLSLLTFTKK